MDYMDYQKTRQFYWLYNLQTR